MPKFLVPRFLTAGLVLTGLASSPRLAAAQDVRDLSVVQAQAYEAGQGRPGPLTVLTLLDRTDATYALGETVRLGIKASADAYVTVLNVGASGRVTQLFPNAAQPDNRVRAGEAIEVPSPQSGAQLTVSGPVGAELIKVIATSKPLAVVRADQLQGSGLFRTLAGDVESLKRDLTVVANTPQGDGDLAVANQIIKTVPGRAAGGAVLVPSPLARPSAAPGGPTGFPLLLAADRASYRAGERLVLAVTTIEPCFLSVVSQNAGGQVRQLFPTSALPMNQVGALQTVLVSGGSAPQSVIATGPGQETITAYCTREPRPPGVIRAVGEVVPPEAKADLDRDVAVVASRPAGSFGYAQIAVTVTP